MFGKVLVANRGEIAIRAFRAAFELGVSTVAVYPYEDRNSLHRAKADESYQIGEPGRPVRAYLSVDEVVKAARTAGADAIYPGYGFLSENPELSAACAEAGITFIGPPTSVLNLTGNKARAVAAAREAGIPVLTSSEPSDDVDTLVAAAERHRVPGVRQGRRRRRRPWHAAGRRAGRPARVDRRGDARGGVGVRRRDGLPRAGRRQPAPHRGADPRRRRGQRRRTCTSATARCSGGTRRSSRSRPRRTSTRTCGTGSAPTRSPSPATSATSTRARWSSCVDERGNHVFIEMNPRIQVEHTVTEQVTDRDLVIAQLRIAAGMTLPELNLTQDDITLTGAAMQCRITTEDPANGFRPDKGTISAYRSPGGPGVRLDGGTVHTGAEVSAHFDSMLVKLTCHGHDFANAARRARRAIAEFRIRGVSTNLPFLAAVLDDPDFRAGRITTSFIDQRPELLHARPSADRGSRVLRYLAETTVNRPHGPRPQVVEPAEKLPAVALSEAPPEGSRQRLAALGPEAFAASLRAQEAVAVTDTTFRDAHQSLLATRVRTRDLLAVAPYMARTAPELLSLECWGGATYDVALRFLAEDPWERLATLRSAVPNICTQMLLRGRNTVGYTPYPTEVTDAFVAEAAATGMDIFRIFDALNDVSQMRPAIDAVRATGTAVAEVALCYTAELSDPSETLYTLDYYLRLAEQIVEAGAHVLAIKDMAGLLRPPAARTLVTALRSRFDLPVHLHTHDTAGGQLATLIAAIDAGVDAVDAAVASMAGTTSQPSLSALVAATDHTATRDGPVAGRRRRPGAVLGGRTQGVRAVRVRPGLADRPRLPPRDPRRPAVEPAPAGDRAGPGRPVRADRGLLRRRGPDAGPPGQGHPVLQGRGRPGPAPGRRGCVGGDFESDPGKFDVPDSVWAFVIPVRLTVIVDVPLPLLVLTEPAPDVMAALVNVTGATKVRTT